MTSSQDRWYSAGEWDLEIHPQRPWLAIPVAEIWQYRDLLLLLVRRDFVSLYKQTILGPLWFLLQPLLTTLMFTLVFGRIAGLSTDGLPRILFYLAGVTCWTFISDTLTKTSETFVQNASLFGKVYFPRMIIPLSIVLSSLIKFGVQFVLFLAFLGWHLFHGAMVHPNAAMLLLPLFLLLMGGIGLGLGMIVTALTTKYRDLRFLLSFAIQLIMYATPVIYPLSSLPGEYRWLLMANPLTPIIEGFRFAFLGQGVLHWLHLFYSTGFMALVLFVALVIFTRVEQTFMDTV
ncbi:MAG: ABC transporter permease [Magnetococcales bacterium]|nr:ABC transporter permease [Magnetococcales bacterium]